MSVPVQSKSTSLEGRKLVASTLYQPFLQWESSLLGLHPATDYDAELVADLLTVSFNTP